MRSHPSTPLPTPASEAAAARPKVLRRPPQFSQPSTPLAVPDTGEPTPPIAGKRASITPSIATHWQEDGRFGLIVIVLVALINLVLSFALPLVTRQPATTVPVTTTLSDSNAMPSAMAARNAARVTTYAEDRTGSAARTSMDLDSLPDDYNHFSIGSDEMPIPTAQPVAQDAR